MTENGSKLDLSECGVLLVATGPRYLEAARRTARNIKRHMPELKVALFTDKPEDVGAGYFDIILPIENPHRRSKVACLHQTPFERTLYIDTDVRVLEDISDVFKILDRFDIALTHAHARRRPETRAVWRKELPNAFPQFNGGVVLYRASDAAKDLMSAWAEAYVQANFKKDQVTLRELVWDSDARIYVLPPEYNVRYKKYFDVWRASEARPVVVHLREFHDMNTTFAYRIRWRLTEFAEEMARALLLAGGAIRRVLAPRGTLN